MNGTLTLRGIIKKQEKQPKPDHPARAMIGQNVVIQMRKGVIHTGLLVAYTKGVATLSNATTIGKVNTVIIPELHVNMYKDVAHFHAAEGVIVGSN